MSNDKLNKEDIKEIAKKNISEILPDVEFGGFDDEDNFAIRDLGCNSIDFAEIVMGVQEDLGLKVPLAELGKAKTINELVDTCFESKNKENQ